MSKPKSQHIIPRCYLKQFVDPSTPAGHEPYVWIFERDSKIGKKKAPKNILAETDFYTLKGDYVIEKTLAQIEGDYARIYENKIKKRIPLAPYEHLMFCAFVAAMLQRTLKQKENIEHFMDEVIGHTRQLERVHGVPSKTSLEWESAKGDAHKLSVIQMVPEITKILYRMNVAFLCSKDKSVSFITSDSPAYLFNSRLQFQRSYAPGLGQRHIEVRLPLSPEITVLFSWVNNLRGYLMVGRDLVHEQNRMLYGHSHRYFIANSKKLRRRWFRRLPLDPVFLLRFVRSKIGAESVRRIRR